MYLLLLEHFKHVFINFFAVYVIQQVFRMLSLLVITGLLAFASGTPCGKSLLFMKSVIPITKIRVPSLTLYKYMTHWFGHSLVLRLCK